MKKTAFKKSGYVLKSYTPLKGYKPMKLGKWSNKPKTPLKSLIKTKKRPPTLQKQLDKIFSECIRRIHSNYMGYVSCATCGKVQHWKQVDCGHFRDRAHMGTRYDPRNVAPQCTDCNRINDGENLMFAYYLDSVHGKGTAELMTKLSQQVVHNFDYKEEIMKWSDNLRMLKESHGE